MKTVATDVFGMIGQLAPATEDVYERDTDFVADGGDSRVPSIYLSGQCLVVAAGKVGNQRKIGQVTNVDVGGRACDKRCEQVAQLELIRFDRDARIEIIDGEPDDYDGRLHRERHWQLVAGGL